jgi:hypothetical protein
MSSIVHGITEHPVQFVRGDKIRIAFVSVSFLLKHISSNPEEDKIIFKLN